MTRWEYGQHGDVYEDELLSSINKVGEEGWEVIVCERRVEKEWVGEKLIDVARYNVIVKRPLKD